MSPEYLAGFFDGEGSIMMVLNTKRSSGHHYYYPRLNISNTNRAILEEIALHYGGHVKVKNYNLHRPNWRSAYSWVAGTLENTERVLRILEPHLRIKRKQALLMLAWFEKRPRNGATVYRKMQHLNQRGMMAA